jgi:hypothetical protein
MKFCLERANLVKECACDFRRHREGSFAIERLQDTVEVEVHILWLCCIVSIWKSDSDTNPCFVDHTVFVFGRLEPFCGSTSTM